MMSLLNTAPPGTGLSKAPAGPPVNSERGRVRRSAPRLPAAPWRREQACPQSLLALLATQGGLLPLVLARPGRTVGLEVREQVQRHGGDLLDGLGEDRLVV